MPLNFRYEYLAPKALDGDPDTFFATGYDEAWYEDTTEWLMIDFGDRYPIAQIQPVGDSLDFLGNFKVKQQNKFVINYGPVN